MALKRKAHAEWTGDLKGGKGQLSTESGALESEAYNFATRFENKPGTNPEELIAAAHAGCFSMALALTLSKKGYDPKKIKTSAVCHLVKLDEGGFAITQMHLDVEAEVPGLDQATFGEIVKAADKGCPVSNLLRSGLDISIEATLS